MQRQKSPLTHMTLAMLALFGTTCEGEQNNRHRKLTIGTITPWSMEHGRLENERQIVSFAVAALIHRASRPKETTVLIVPDIRESKSYHYDLSR